MRMSACLCVCAQSSDDEDGLGKGRGRHIVVNKADMPGWAETLDSFRAARESWDLLHSHEALESGTLGSTRIAQLALSIVKCFSVSIN